jgi:hypothetical protein
VVRHSCSWPSWRDDRGHGLYINTFRPWPWGRGGLTRERVNGDVGRRLDVGYDGSLFVCRRAGTVFCGKSRRCVCVGCDGYFRYGVAGCSLCKGNANCGDMSSLFLRKYVTEGLKGRSVMEREREEES